MFTPRPLSATLLSLIAELGQHHTVVLTALESGGTGHHSGSYHYYGDGCGSSEVSWLRCEDESVAVSGAVDAFVLAAEVEAPVVLEVAAGDQGAEFQDGLGAF